MRGRTRGEPRLDPVRWRRPGRPALLRSAVMTALIATAALVMWAGPGTCGPACSDSGSDPAGAPQRSSAPGGTDRSPARVPDRPAVPPGLIGVPVRLAEPTALKLVQAGDRVDLFRVADAGDSPQGIATAALVLGVTGAEDPTTGGLLLALTPAEARRTVTAPGAGYAILIRPD